MIIPINLYKKIIESIPIVCVDIIIQNNQSKILLVKRNTEPLKEEWWVIGGRINKGENILEAAKRKVLEEVGLKIINLDFFGIYEDQYENSAFSNNSNYHTISIVYKTRVQNIDGFKLNKYSSSWKWSKSLPKRFIVNKVIK